MIVKVGGDRWLCANHPGTKSIVLDIFKSLSVLRSIIIITCETKVLAVLCSHVSDRKFSAEDDPGSEP